VSLTPRQARALAGEWYHWFVEQQQARNEPTAHWEFMREAVGDEISSAILAYSSDVNDPERGEEVDFIWERHPEARATVRPMLADWGETSRFLAARRIVLDNASRDLFLDALYADFAAALKLLIRRARGDYSPDTHSLQFPKFNGTDAGHTAWHLFERWIAAKRPRASTVDRWRAVFLRLKEDFGNRSVTAITPEEAQEWITGLVNSERTAQTVHDVWRAAIRTVFGWAGSQASPEGPLRRRAGHSATQGHQA
jgi:hypothetical protein